MVLESVFLYKQYVANLSNNKLKLEQWRKEKHNKRTGDTQSKLWVLQNETQKRKEIRELKKEEQLKDSDLEKALEISKNTVINSDLEKAIEESKKEFRNFNAHY